MVDRLVDSEFRFVDQRRRKNVRERYYSVVVFGVVLRPGCKLAGWDCLHSLIRIKADECRCPFGKMLIEPNHPGVFVIDLSAQSGVLPHVGTGSGRRAGRISLQDRRK
jgi:hypothetical protein